MTDFKLLQHLSKSLKNPSSLPLNLLRVKTKEYRALHNEVMERIWSLKGDLTTAIDEAGRVELNKQINELEKVLKDCSTEVQLKELLKVIKDKEITECGFSKIGGLSPYSL